MSSFQNSINQIWAFSFEKYLISLSSAQYDDICVFMFIRTRSSTTIRTLDFMELIDHALDRIRL